jgi:hypothetical protein
MLAIALRLLVAMCLVATAALSGGAAQSTAVARDQVSLHFTPVTSEAGITFQNVNGASPDKYMVETMGSGGLFFDYDRDGWVDVFLVDGGSIADRKAAAAANHRLYRNRGKDAREWELKMLNQEASASLQTGDRDTAIAALQKATTLAPDVANGYLSLGCGAQVSRQAHRSDRAVPQGARVERRFCCLPPAGRELRGSWPGERSGNVSQ